MYIPGFKEIAASAAAFFRNRPGDEPEHRAAAVEVDETYNRLRERGDLEGALSVINRRLNSFDIVASDFDRYMNARTVLALEIVKRLRP